MIIHPPSCHEVAGSIRISSRIELGRPDKSFPDELWFEFPKKSNPRLSSEPFAVALILLAMQLGEPIHVRGRVSRKLADGLEDYQKIFHSWFPDRFKPVLLTADEWNHSDSIGSGIGCAFSGGVDSFYSLLALRGRVTGEAPAALTHLLFMAGFDMPLNLTASIAELRGSFETLSQELGLTLVSGRTNVRGFVNTVDWTNSHGQALIASALFFQDQWKEFYIPSSYTHGNYPRWGTHPKLDPLLSTESLKFVHHGAETSRIRKLESVAASPESYARLRVCWIQDLGLNNCGSCEKCIRTMTALKILGKLGRYTTFRKRLNSGQILKLKMRTYQARHFARELIAESARRKKLGIWASLRFSLLKRNVFHRLNHG